MLPQQPGDSLRISRISTGQAMRSQQPDVTVTTSGSGGTWFAFSSSIGSRSESGEDQVDIEIPELQQLRTEHVDVPLDFS